MNKEDQEKVDIKNYIPYFRKFHLFLGISLLLVGLALTYLVNDEVGGIFMGVYPIAAYLYFAWNSRKYYKNVKSKWNKFGVYVLIGTLIFVGGLMFAGLKEDPIIIHSQSIEFTGSYSETLKQSEIQSIELVQQIPNISWKTNGFALGKIRKGYFKTKQGETIKLIINADKASYILFIKTNGENLYFSAKEKSNEVILNEIKTALAEIEYK